jgi:hypothetical protein
MTSPEVQEDLESYIRIRKAWVDDAVELVGGSRGTDPLTVFPESTDVRREAPGLELDAEQEKGLREIAGRFGIGGESDVTSSASHHLLEGGLVWKIEAEAANVGRAETIIFSGWPARIIGEKEVEHIQKKFGIDMTSKSEYDVARFVAEQQAGFVPLEEDEVQPFGYDITRDYALVQEPSGQLVKIGNKDGVPVLLVRVDENKNELDERGRPKKPDGADLLVFMGEVLSAVGDETSGVALGTSTTYASRLIDTVRAGLHSGRFFDVSMYGRQTLADVKDVSVADPTEIHQIPSEIHTVYTKLLLLEQDLQKDADSSQNENSLE